MTTTNFTTSKRPSFAEPTAAPLFARSAGALAITAGTLLLVGQLIWWPFDQLKNVTTSQDAIFNAGSLVYLAGFCVLMFALIGVHAVQAAKAGRLGTFGVSAAILGTMLLGGDLWFESFAVPWVASSPSAEVLEGDVAALMVVGALSSYFLFVAGWVAFGFASLRARVFPAWISVLIMVGGIAGYWALLAPGGIPLAVAILTLGVWLVHNRHQAVSHRVHEGSATASS